MFMLCACLGWSSFYDSRLQQSGQDGSGVNRAPASFIKSYCFKQTHGISNSYLEQMNMRAGVSKHKEEMLLEEIHPND